MYYDDDGKLCWKNEHRGTVAGKHVKTMSKTQMRAADKLDKLAIDYMRRAEAGEIYIAQRRSVDDPSVFEYLYWGGE